MKINPYIGKFIAFEGLDGSGQSSQAELLRDYLRDKDFEVVLTKEPTPDSKFSKRIREILDEKDYISATALQALFADDRKEHLKNLIIPALEKGKIVISDRYFFSSFAYGTADGVDLDWLIKINNKFLLPDLTIFLKVRPEICLQRIEGRGKEKTLFEEIEKLKKVWQVFEHLAKKIPSSSEALREGGKNVIIMDGEKTIEQVFSEVKEVVNSKFKI